MRCVSQAVSDTYSAGKEQVQKLTGGAAASEST